MFWSTVRLVDVFFSAGFNIRKFRHVMFIKAETTLQGKNVEVNCALTLNFALHVDELSDSQSSPFNFRNREPNRGKALHALQEQWPICRSCW